MLFSNNVYVIGLIIIKVLYASTLLIGTFVKKFYFNNFIRQKDFFNGLLKEDEWAMSQVDGLARKLGLYQTSLNKTNLGRGEL